MPRSKVARKPRPIRLPDDVDARLVEAAALMGVSVNRAVEFAVRVAFGTGDQQPPEHGFNVGDKLITDTGDELHVIATKPRVRPEQAVCEHNWQRLPYMTRCTRCGVRR